MAAVSSALRAGLSVRPVVGGFTLPVRGAQYSPAFVKPIGTEREELRAKLDSPEVTAIMYNPVRAATPDVSNSIFYDPLLARFTNIFMRKGMKREASEVIHRAFYSIKLMKSPNGLNPLQTFEQAVRNATPVLELAKVTRGGIEYQVPVPLSQSRAEFIAMRWIIQAAQDKERHVRIWDQMARELIDASNNVGRVVTQKQESHKAAEANKAYAHYRYG